MEAQGKYVLIGCNEESHSLQSTQGGTAHTPSHHTLRKSVIMEVNMLSAFTFGLTDDIFAMLDVSNTLLNWVMTFCHSDASIELNIWWNCYMLLCYRTRDIGGVKTILVLA